MTKYLTDIRRMITSESDNWNQKYFRLHPPIIIPAKNDICETVYTYLYIRKPDIEHPQVGDLDFYMESNKFAAYKKLLQKGKQINGVNIFDRPDLDLIMLSDPQVDAVAFIGGKTMVDNINSQRVGNERTFIDKLAFIDIKNRKVLSTLSEDKDTWYIPGGKRKPGEIDKESLIREIKEELSVDIVPSSITYYGTFKAQAHGKDKGVIVRMTCYTGKYRGILKPSSEIKEYKYVKYLWKDKSSPVDKLIFDDLRQKDIID